MMLSQSNSRRVDKGHGCFFSEQFASNSFCGHLDPNFERTYGFSETDVADLIRAGRPDLFTELGQLPLSSTEIIGSGSVLHCGTPGHQSRIPIPCEPRAAAARDKLSDFQQIPSNGERRMLELQHKRYVQLSLLSMCSTAENFVTTDKNRRAPAVPAVTARFLKGLIFLSLWRERRDGSGCIIKRVENHYSLTCFEDLFNGGLTVSTPCDLDGQLNHRADNATGFPFQYPSNSAEARRLREGRYREIEDTLHEDQLRRSRKVKSGDHHGTETPNLKLHRASNISPFVSRYRKQGLGWGEQKRKSKELENPFAAASELQKISSPQRHLICKCRESAGDSELVKCSSSDCMIGTFHLQCLGLDEPIEEGDEVYCMYCAENLVLDESCESEDSGLDASKFVEGHQQLEPEPELSNTRIDLEENTHLSDLATAECDDEGNIQPSEKHRFQAINSPESGTVIFHTVQIDGARPLPPLTPYLKPVKARHCKKLALIPLQPGSSHMGFTDLAPFISLTYEAYSPTGLNEKEVKVFQGWVCSCPNSRLLQVISVKERAKRGLYAGQKGRAVTGGRYVAAGSMGRDPLN